VTGKIYRSILAATLAVFIVTLVMIMGVLYDHFTNVQQKQLKSEVTLAARGVEDDGEGYLEGLDIGEQRFTWIAKDGSVLYDSESDKTTMENHLEREEIREAIEIGYGESERYSTTLMRKSLYSAKLLSDGSVLRLSVDQNSVLLLIIGMLQPILITIVVAAVLAFLLASRLTKRIVEPLNKLDVEAAASGSGEYEYEELKPLVDRLKIQKHEIAMQEQELKQKEAEIEKTEQIRREFTANVSHELKTPLHSISGYSELIKEGVARDEDVKNFAGKIYDETQRLVTLVDDTINLSHLDEGAKDMAWTEVDLYDEAEKVVSALTELAARSDVSISLEPGNKPEGYASVIRAIPDQVHAIIYNLCDNAIKYNKEGGTVTVKVDGTTLSVRDTGIGIPGDQTDRIFERFYRVDKSHSKAVGGTGLGLSIVKHAAEIHDADIEVESKEGEGTEITVRFT